MNSCPRDVFIQLRNLGCLTLPRTEQSLTSVLALVCAPSSEPPQSSLGDIHPFQDILGAARSTARGLCCKKCRGVRKKNTLKPYKSCKSGSYIRIQGCSGGTISPTRFITARSLAVSDNCELFLHDCSTTEQKCKFSAPLLASRATTSPSHTQLPWGALNQTQISP